MKLTKKELNRVLKAAEKVDFNGKNAGDTRFTCNALMYDGTRYREEFYFLRSKYHDFIEPEVYQAIRPIHFEGKRPGTTKKTQDHRVIALLMFWASEGGK